MQNLQDAQRDMRDGNGYGSTGVMVSGFVWLMSSLCFYFVSPQKAVWALLIGGGLIYPLATLLDKVIGLAGNDKNNPLQKLAMEGTIWMLMCIPLALGLAQIKVEWFFQGMLMIIGGRYLTFASLYGLRLYWILGATLGAVSYLLFRLGAGGFLSVLTGGLIEIAFGITMYGMFRYGKSHQVSQ